MTRIVLSLVSHTNVGKTTLARTLLGRDVGEVRDAPHVTEFADVYPMLQTPDGDALCLADTPGFGDSVRLVRRLRQSATPLGWFLSQVWDRWRDRPFWSTQQALRHVRDESDVVLYLVNAAESPEAAGYVPSEMELLVWVGKPVVVLLNQLGTLRDAARDEADVQRWRVHLAAFAPVCSVLPLDAFARCWVQEFTLLQAIEQALPAQRRPLMARLRAAWHDDRWARFDAAMQAIARSLGRIAAAREPIADSARVRERLRQFGAALGFGKGDDGPTAIAQQALAAELDAEVRANTAELIALHGLSGAAQGEILSLLARHYEMRLRVGEGSAALVGGMLTGALAGLKADIATGGLTLGGGLVAGGLIGAISAAGLARCYNIVSGTEHSWLAWNAQALDQAVEAALLRYLAVAHFGRGRGEWTHDEAPPAWKEAVHAVLQARRDTLAHVWRGRSESCDAARIATALQPVLTQAARELLQRLYPDACASGASRPA